MLLGMQKKFTPIYLIFLTLFLSILACNIPTEMVDDLAEGLAETELFVSTSGDDANDCQTLETACRSLFRAVAVANTLPLATIYISAGTYDEGEPVSIDVPAILIGEGEVVINNLLTAPNPNPIPSDPVLSINLPASGAVRLENISLQGVAGIYVINGDLELVNVRLRNITSYGIRATEFEPGVNRSAISIENSEFTNIDGNAIAVSGVTVRVTIRDTTISDIGSTAISNWGGTFTLDGVRIFNARGGEYPSAIRNATTWVSGGGRQYQGGIFSISNSVFYNNTSDEGTIRNAGDLLEITNSTLSGNTGYGVMARLTELPRDGRWREPSRSEVTLIHVTIANHTGTGVVAVDDWRVKLSLNYALIVYNGRDCEIHSLPSGLSIDSDNTCNDVEAVERAAWGFNPGVDGVLGSDGTHALLPDSSAVDAVGCFLPADQRGVARPQGLRCDVGAYELNLEERVGELPVAPTATPLAIVQETTTAGATLPVVPTLISASATPSSAFVRVNTDANCRSGPGTVYSVITGLKAGTEAPAEGRNENNTWWWVLISGGGRCWVSASLVEAIGPVTSLPVIPAPPTPVPTSTPLPPAATATTALQPPSAPVQLFYENVVCTGQAYNVPLRWTDTGGNEQGFRVYRNGSLIATLGANATTYTDAPPYGGPYTYNVEAFNSAGTSAQATVTEPGCIP